MLPRTDWGAAAAATHVVLAEFGVDVRKAIDPSDPAAFDRALVELGDDLRRVVNPQEQGAVERAIAKLDVDWRKMTPAQQTAVVRTANAALAGVPARVMPKVETRSIAAGREMSVATRVALKRELGSTAIRTSFTAVDREMVRLLAKNQSFYVTNEYGRRSATFSRVARNVVARGLERGRSSADIGRELAQVMRKTHLGRSKSYWHTIASVFVGRARAAAQVRSFSEAGIERMQFLAVMDEQTTDECRCLHETIYDVGDGIAQLDRMKSIGEPEEIKNVAPFVRSERLESGERRLFTRTNGGRESTIAVVTRSGYGRADDRGAYRDKASVSKLSGLGLVTPPLHCHCRSTLVPY